MLGFLFFVISLTFGWVLLNQLPLRLTKLERLSFGVVIGMFISSWLLFLPGWLLNFTIAVPLVAALELGVITFLWRRRLGEVIPANTPKVLWQREVLRLAAFLFSLFFLYLCYTHSLQVYADGWYSSGYTWSDLPLHMSLMSNVAYQAKFEFVFPVHYVAKLSYPFLIDLYCGILLRLGLTWQLSVMLPSIVLILSVLQLMLSLTSRLLGSIRAAWLHLILFLASGSAWGFILYLSDVTNGNWRLFLTTDYSNLQASQNLYFANIVTSHFFPQRGFLFGFAIALCCILLITEVYKKKDANHWIIWSVGVLVGLLPFAHTHTFFVLAGLIGLITLNEVITKKSWRTPWLTAFFILLILAFPQLYWQFASTYSSHFGRWFIGWAREKDESFQAFWLRNFGVIFPFLLINYWVLKKYIKDTLVWYIYALSMLIFIAINVRIFQPSLFDNMKFLVYGYWGISLVMSYILAKWSRSFWGAIAVALIMVSVCGSGVLALARETTIQWPEFSTDEVQFASDFMKLVPPEARVLTTTRHNHPIPTLTGRRILLGYEGWLWSYGIDATQVDSDVRSIFQGASPAQLLLERYNVDVITFSEAEVYQNGINLAYFLKNHQLIYHNKGWFVFSSQLISSYAP